MFPTIPGGATFGLGGFWTLGSSLIWEFVLLWEVAKIGLDSKVEYKVSCSRRKPHCSGDRGTRFLKNETVGFWCSKGKIFGLKMEEAPIVGSKFFV